MSSGLLALLDDIAAIVKASASSIDGVASQAAAAGSKAAGVVIDDAAVTPKYVVGLSPSRELPIIWNIAKGSLKNKILYLMPAALALGYAAHWAVAPILALGGVYLCYEGYEKLHEAYEAYFHPESYDKSPDDAVVDVITPEELERLRTVGAIRTDFILSAEIMAISYNAVMDQSLVTQIFVLFFVALSITAGVYGFVAAIVKADDLGLHLVKRGRTKLVKKFGRALIDYMPVFLSVLGKIGTAAMLWVGGGIIIHSIGPFHHMLEQILHTVHLEGFLLWLFEASISGLFGILVGFFAIKGYFIALKFLPKKLFKMS